MSYRKARREAVVSLLLFAVACIWTVGGSYYLNSLEPAPLVFGMPRWAVLGIFLPWVVFFVLHTWFTLWFQRPGGKQ